MFSEKTDHILIYIILSYINRLKFIFQPWSQEISLEKNQFVWWFNQIKKAFDPCYIANRHLFWLDFLLDMS